MLLAVALALLAAQVIAGVFLYRGAAARAEAEVVNALAFQMIGDVRDPRARWRERGDERRGGFAQRRRALALSLIEDGQRGRRVREPDRERLVGDILQLVGQRV